MVDARLTDRPLLTHPGRFLAETPGALQLVQNPLSSRNVLRLSGVLLCPPQSLFASTSHRTLESGFLPPSLCTPCYSRLPCYSPHTTLIDRHYRILHTMPPPDTASGAAASAPVHTRQSSTTLPSTVHTGTSVLQPHTRHMRVRVEGFLPFCAVGWRISPFLHLRIPTSAHSLMRGFLTSEDRQLVQLPPPPAPGVAGEGAALSVH